FIDRMDLFDKITSVEPSSLGTVLFMYEDPMLKQIIPQTYAMFFNIQNIKRLIRKYKLSCGTYRWNQLSSAAKSALNSIGIDGTNVPEQGFGKDYFDTF